MLDCIHRISSESKAASRPYNINDLIQNFFCVVTQANDLSMTSLSINKSCKITDCEEASIFFQNVC